MTEQDQHNDFESFCAGYVLDALTEEERKRFEEMLQDASPEQKKLYEEMKEVRDELALATEPMTPSPAVEERIMNSISAASPATSEKASRSEIIIPIWTYKAAAAILLIASLVFSYRTLDLSGRVENQQTEITELRSQLDRQEQLLSILSARQITLVNMNGQEPSPEGYGKILWDPDRGEAVLQLANLPAPPQDKDYQLWLIKEGENPISAGVFNFEEPSTDLFFRVERLIEEPSPQSNAFAVTLEPKGGVPQPTGDMFLLGQQD